jgi:hypothetical protein
MPTNIFFKRIQRNHILGLPETILNSMYSRELHLKNAVS